LCRRETDNEEGDEDLSTGSGGDGGELLGLCAITTGDTTSLNSGFLTKGDLLSKGDLSTLSIFSAIGGLNCFVAGYFFLLVSMGLLSL